MLKGEVLLLNKSYEVLRVVSVRRALCMMLRKNNPAVEEMASGGVLRTASGQVFSVPSVIVLTEYRDIRKRISVSNAKRLKVLTRDSYTCMYCGVKPGISKLTLDHVMPKSRGGLDAPENLVAACKPCNNKKDNRTPEEARMKLIRKPRPVQTGFDRIMNRVYLERHPEWKDYLFLSDNANGDLRYQAAGD
jgi:5-methylcytosine-specific restriction endonuclease McrA